MQNTAISTRTVRRQVSTLTALTTSILFMQANLAHAENSAVAFSNIADGSYIVAGSNSAKLSVRSNQVFVNPSSPKPEPEPELPKPEYKIELSQAPTKTVAPGATVQWINTLTNNSSVDETVRLEYGIPNTVSNFEVYQDINKNGLIDANDVLVTNQIKIGQGESIDLIVKALTNKDLQDNTSTGIKIGAVVIEDETVSAHVTDNLIIVAPSIEFTDSSFSKIEAREQIGDEVHVQARYAQCNVRYDTPDQILLKITSTKTNDTYTQKATETGNNTGIFRLSAPTELQANAINDEIIQTLDGDMLKASIQSCILPNGEQLNVTANITSEIEMMDEAPNLQVVKKADVKKAELGDYVNYSINISNLGKNTTTAYDVALKDAIPRGFDYVKGSTRVDGKPVADFKTEGKYKEIISLEDKPIYT